MPALHHPQKAWSQQTQPHDCHHHRMGHEYHSEVGGGNPEDSSSAHYKGCAAKADKGIDAIKVAGFAERVFAFFGGSGVAK